MTVTKVLCVAEKPSIARAVAGHLGGGHVTRRQYKGNISNHVFKFDFGGDLGQCDVTMTHVFGHLYRGDFPRTFAWNQCPHDVLFSAPTMELVDNQDIFDNIANEARTAQYLMIWTDCDREGEYIGYEILKAASTYNRRFTVATALRAKFSHTERNHVISAARRAGHLQQGAIDAVEVRRELDLRTGSAFTRLLTGVFKPELDKERAAPKERSKIISYGGCQFPTLGFVVDRYKRVREFVPQAFWFISVELVKENQAVVFAWDRKNAFDRLSVALLFENSHLAVKDVARITAVGEKPTRNYRPFPLTTVELQKNGSRYLKMTAKKVLDTAEKLYNNGYLSYPRTETDRFPAAMDLRALVMKQTQDPEWGAYASSLVDGSKFRQPRAGSHDDKAHPPIHPIKGRSTDRLTADERKVYEYVTRHFLACCSEDAIGSMTNVSLQWGDEKFHASGLTVIARNYLDVFPYFSWSSSKVLPKFEPGEQVKLAKAHVKTGKTSPPTHMTEAELIALMDANGIGTDATMADHIEKIIERQYITKQKARSKEFFVPTLLGMSLVEGFNKLGFDNVSLSKPFLRKNLEVRLTDISEGRTTKETVKHEIVELYREAYALTTRKQTTLLAEYRDCKRANGVVN